MNFTYSENLHDSGLIFALMLTFMAVLAPFITIGNLFVVLAVYKNYNLRTPTNFILTSLAVNDMVSSVAFALNCYPAVFSLKTWYPNMADLLWLPSSTLCSSTLLHIVALTVDRYIAVTKPLKYPTLVTPKRVGYAIASIWILSFIVLVVLGYIDLNEVQNANRDRESHNSLAIVTFSLVIVSFLVLTLLVIVVSNLRIMQIAVKQARAIANQTINDQNNRVAPGAVERRLKAVKTTGIIVGVLVFFWSPYIVFFTLQATPLADEASVVYLNLCFLVAIAIAASLNPFIYHHRDREFRNTFLEIFRAASNKFKC
ncbi:histamine H2 receptor-like [Strongylocentrotus purpuratus]|uniref:G-protein coupled receptors family 1 profile domain-containing protein n=1 Tax=Strongylocentrotus purpuratus TaxID=7668 RepID=A0A7M7HG59_STRPU|nr:histamine H2 receptor-like [Strongylocentrotus purpuratus]|eukprot:XP_011673354.1 PREDICTED: histamine H2 receptor-like [Strongylocentrotus purpuratus]